MKEVPLICNAHIDPIWQWEWEEGAAAALSTFRAAAIQGLMEYPTKELDDAAGEFNNPPYVCNVFPIETDIVPAPFSLTISDNNITLVTVKKAEDSDDCILRLHNNSPREKSAAVAFCNAQIDHSFGRYEAKALRYDGKSLTESEEMVI